MALNQWFKFYGGEFLSDPKIAALSAQERSCWITLLSLASISSTPGTVEYLTVEVLLTKSGIDFDPYNPEEWNAALAVLDKFVRMKMITKSEEGVIQINNWVKRQETALTNAERQAKYRKSNEKVTESVTKVTLDKIRIDKNMNTAKADFEIVESSDSDSVVKKPKADPNVERAAKHFHLKCKENYDIEPSGGLVKSMGIVKRANLSLPFGAIRKMIDDWFEEDALDAADMIQITKCLSAYRIDQFKAASL